jgi:hypothetical protein
MASLTRCELSRGHGVVLGLELEEAWPWRGAWHSTAQVAAVATTTKLRIYGERRMERRRGRSTRGRRAGRKADSDHLGMAWSRRGHCSLLPAGSIRFQDRITDWAAAAYGVRTVTNYGSNRR